MFTVSVVCLFLSACLLILCGSWIWTYNGTNNGVALKAAKFWFWPSVVATLLSFAAMTYYQ